MLLGKITFRDEMNDITGFIEIGSVRRKPRDYLQGYIEQYGEKVCEKIEGTYMGYVDFDGERYFDVREMDNY
jgi:hypothetical protein